MVVNERPLKRLRTRVTADLNDFFTFPDSLTEFSTGPFRSNIRSFLTKRSHLQPSSLSPCVLLWQIFFQIGELDNRSDPSAPETVTLDVIEEDVTRVGKIGSAYCDQCRVVGWSGHPVCRKRYYFVVRANNSSTEGHQMPCKTCGNLMLFSDFRCMTCKYELTDEDLHEWLRVQSEDATHLLHGVVHSNGYGHLLRVNGREGGSKLLSGCDIMDFWDRLCKTLGTRKISVMDVSKKYGLELRVLHAVTNGQTWYGKWGFKFGAGSYGLTCDNYQKAVDSLSEMPLSIFFQARKPRTHLQDLITFYQALSDTQISTVRELFCFLIGLIRKTAQYHLDSKTRKNRSCSQVLCTWTRDDIEHVQQSMIKVLQVAGRSCWVSWRALKGATCRLASPELLDYCLKAIGRKVLDDGRMILSRCNPELGVLEYRLVPKSDVSDTGSAPEANCPSKHHILSDLRVIFVALFDPRTMLRDQPKATRERVISYARTLLDCKKFVKDYDSERFFDPNPDSLTYSCQVELINVPVNYTAPPPELVYLPLNATVSDLKIEATKAYKDVYIFFKTFEVEELLGYEQAEIDDSFQLNVMIGSSCSVTVSGRFHSLNGVVPFRVERGEESWTVNCKCGIKDDDGERMLACDVCGVWFHTRCVGIEDQDPDPVCFACSKCSSTKQATPQSRTGRRLSSASKGRKGSRVVLEKFPIYSRTGLHKQHSSMSSDKTVVLSKTGSDKCRRTGSKCKDATLSAEQIFEHMFYSEIDSPTQSATSGISNCKAEFADIVQPCVPRNGLSSRFHKYKYETQEVDAYSSQIESPNLSGTTSESPNLSGTTSESPNLSGTTSEESTAVLDTCSSNIEFDKHANDEDTSRVKTGFKVRFARR